MSHILAAVDFSDFANSVVAQAERFGKALGAPVTLIHVAAPNPDFVGYEAGPQTVRDARAETLRAEHAKLLEHATELCERGVNANAVLVEGASAATILKEADRLEADLIVIGSHGHGKVYEVLVGSVCDGVVRRSTCPVMIVPHGRST